MPNRNADGSWPERNSETGSELWLDATDLPEQPPPMDVRHARPYDEYAKRPGVRRMKETQKSDHDHDWQFVHVAVQHLPILVFCSTCGLSGKVEAI